jgi:ataxin-3
MREQQEFAQRELWSANGLMPEQQAQQDARRQERQRQEEEEAEQLRQAIIESEAMARERQERGEGQPSHDTSTAVLSNRGQADSDITSFDHTALDDRNYDDEDAELQAALRASLENILPGWQRPEVLPPNLPKDPELPSQSDRGTTPTKNTKEPYNMDVDEDEEWHSESESSNLGDVASEKSDRLATTQQSATSLAEIRQARLARFGS